jgi:hypothetical protein
MEERVWTRMYTICATHTYMYEYRRLWTNAHQLCLVGGQISLASYSLLIAQFRGQTLNLEKFRGQMVQDTRQKSLFVLQSAGGNLSRDVCTYDSMIDTNLVLFICVYVYHIQCYILSKRRILQYL